MTGEFKDYYSASRIIIKEGFVPIGNRRFRNCKDFKCRLFAFLQEYRDGSFSIMCG